MTALYTECVDSRLNYASINSKKTKNALQGRKFKISFILGLASTSILRRAALKAVRAANRGDCLFFDLGRNFAAQQSTAISIVSDKDASHSSSLKVHIPAMRVVAVS